MKSLTCEMCGSQNVLKEDGVFVCQACGTKYSVEEAKKMMIEGTVEVQGTVKVDKTKVTENNLTSARQSLAIKDWSAAKNFYSLVRQDNPDNIEAFVYNSYCQAMESLRVNAIYERQSIFETLKNSLFIFCIEYIIDNIHEYLLIRISEDILELVNTSFVYTSHTINGIETSNDSKETTTLFCDILAAYALSSVNYIAKKYESENPQMVCYIHTSAIILYETLLKLGCLGKDVAKIQDKIMESHRKIASIDSSHIVPLEPPKGPKKSGCYVATCVYGSYDCPEVWTLRRYRDNTLGSTWYGRAFIRIYYAISPTFVKWFGKTKWFKKMWKGKLDRMVKKLQDKGVENTPYEDKNW